MSGPVALQSSKGVNNIVDVRILLNRRLQLHMSYSGDEKGYEKLNNHSTFAGVPPDCKLHGMVLYLSDIFASPESLVDFFILDEVVVFEK
jgi:hypothetical protein